MNVSITRFDATFALATWMAIGFVVQTVQAEKISYGDYLPVDVRHRLAQDFGSQLPVVFRGQNEVLPPPGAELQGVSARSVLHRDQYSNIELAVDKYTATSEAGSNARQKYDTCDDCGKATHACRCPLPSCYCCPQTTSVYGEYLLLHTTGADMVYGIPQDGIGTPGTAPSGALGTLDHSYESGVRIGVRKRLSECAAVHLSYAWFESEVKDAIEVTGANVINPVMFVPTVANAGDNAQRAEGKYNVRFQIADVDYRYRWICSVLGHMDVVLGGRYANLKQDITATYRFAPPDGTTVTNTNIDFDGGGLRIGLDGERCVHGCSRLKVYGKGFASVLSGSFKSDYRQISQFNGTEAVVQWEDDRFVPILEGELGIALEHGHFRLAAGYQMSAWFNTVTTPVFVDAVKAGNYDDIHGTITFDGLVTRLEVVW